MSRVEIITALVAAIGVLLGAVGTYRQARGTERRTVADMYGEALDRLDGRLVKAELRIDDLETALVAEREHSMRQDVRLKEQDARITRLRAVVAAWAQWGKWLQKDWDTIRQNPSAPDLPNTQPE